jgi:hypothetical protein
MEQEQILIDIVRMLPPERIAQIVDFARFLEAQALAEEMASAESSAEIEAEIAKWDALLATERAQDVLDALADEALEEHQAGETRPMYHTGERQMEPG